MPYNFTEMKTTNRTNVDYSLNSYLVGIIFCEEENSEEQNTQNVCKSAHVIHITWAHFLFLKIEREKCLGNSIDSDFMYFPGL